MVADTIFGKGSKFFLDGPKNLKHSFMQLFPDEKKATLKSKVEDSPIQIIPISSISLLVVFGDTIEIAINEKVMAFHFFLKQKKLPWIEELTPAYASLGVRYNLRFIKSDFKIEGLVFDWVKNLLDGFLAVAMQEINVEQAMVEIPVCFDGALPNDLPLMSKSLDLSIHKIIDIFLSKTYHVFMLGFLPGFSYMGEVDGKISISRKITPTPTRAGAVGIAGCQTGIYPLTSLGGWHILGHTPLNMFNPKINEPALLQVGNKIKFVQITDKQYFMINNKTLS